MFIESGMGNFQMVKVMDNSSKEWDGKLYANFLEYDKRLSCFELVENDPCHWLLLEDDILLSRGVLRDMYTYGDDDKVI